MAVAFDATSNSGTASPGQTGNISFTHTPVGTPKGVIVFINQSIGTGAGGSEDEVTAVTYGGQAMTRLAIAQDAVGEPGASYAYFLGSSVPTGAQTVAVTVGGDAGHVRRACCITVTASGDTEALSGTSVVNQANPNVTVSALDATKEYFVAATLFTGGNGPADFSGGADYTEIHEHDLGNQAGGSLRRTNNISGATSVTADWVAGASTGVAAIGVALVDTASLKARSGLTTLLVG
jgi:hypothetical protein